MKDLKQVTLVIAIALAFCMVVLITVLNEYNELQVEKSEQVRLRIECEQSMKNHNQNYHQ